MKRSNPRLGHFNRSGTEMQYRRGGNKKKRSREKEKDN